MILEALSSKPSLFVIEAAVTLVVLALAVALPSTASRQFSSIEHFFGRLARKRRAMVVTLGVLACALRLALLPVVPIPQPYIHDEFSFLLASDTFASGRLANPTHPMWQHFESFHISHVPTYMSMYFPAQGFALAAGKVLFGHPWFGVLLSAGIFCGALYWMLAGWLPPGWALFGGMLAVVRLALFSYWTNSYYGGFVPAIGGTLVLGALPRLRRSLVARNLILMALGLAILANSRPYEGLLVGLPAVVTLISWHARLAPARWGLILRQTATPIAVLLLTMGGMAYYNYRVFGNPLTIPYHVNRATYASAPNFLWQTPRPEPVYRHKVMQVFYTNWELRDFNEARTPRGFVVATLQKLGTSLFFVFGFALLPPLIFLPRALRDRRIRYLSYASVIFGVGLCCNAWLFAHYLAPFIGGMYVILLQCMRHLRACNSGDRRWGVPVVRSLALACLLLLCIRTMAGPLGIAIERWPTSWYGTQPFGLARAAVQSQLAGMPGKQLVLVHYSPTHAPFDDWVYNDADIDHSKVVWAREMDPANNATLLRYFSDRQAWLVQPDSGAPGPVPIANADLALLSRIEAEQAASAVPGVQSHELQSHEGAAKP